MRHLLWKSEIDLAPGFNHHAQVETWATFVPSDGGGCFRVEVIASYGDDFKGEARGVCSPGYLPSPGGDLWVTLTDVAVRDLVRDFEEHQGGALVSWALECQAQAGKVLDSIRASKERAGQ